MNLDIWFSIGVSIDSDIDPYKSEENIDEITEWED